MKKYKIKVTKELIKKLKPYWEQLEVLQCEYIGKVFQLEEKMSKEVGIKDLEFFMCDGEYVGIGNIDRTMKLIHGYQLEKE